MPWLRVPEQELEKLHDLTLGLDDLDSSLKSLERRAW